MPRLKDDPDARREFIAIGESMCDPNAYVPEEFRLSHWEDLARRRAGERGVKAWRRMITTWVNDAVGRTPLADYANREYPELIRDYYLPRWKKFFKGEIYHDGWIDFNKNGRKDVYEDPSQSVDVTNTGKRPGAEVVQLYVRDKFSSVVTYDSVLRGFEKVQLQPGETRRVTFTLKPEDLAILDADMNWAVEAGDFEIMVGASSEDIRQRENLRVEKTILISSISSSYCSYF